MATILRLMGGLRAEPSGFTQPKPLLLLAYLALEGPQPRRRLAELFWRGELRMKSLSMAMTRLRQGAGDVFEADERRVAATVTSDAGALLEALGAGDWARAHELYAGPFLDAADDDGWGHELEEWVVGTREYLAERVQHGLLELAEAAAQAGRFEEAGEVAARAWRLPGAAALDPATLGRLYRLLTAGRSRHAPTVRHELDEYGGVLAVTTAQARSSLRRPAPPATGAGATEVGAAGAGAAGPSDAARGGGTNGRTADRLPQLVAPRTNFVGREPELARIAAALAAPEARLVTLVGGGGVGKSRLALEAALQAERSGRYPGGVHQVAIGFVSGARALADGILQALGTASEPGADAWARLGALAPARTLLLLDDVGGAVAAELGDLLVAAPTIDLLATARGRLGLAEEDAIVVAGLDVPAAGTPWAEAAASGAVRLIVDRARQVQAAIELAPQAAALIELCRVLDGSPLALELVAPWTRLLSCAEILERLDVDPAFGVAEDEAGDPPPRTLRGVFETSWALLAEPERAVARRLAVFRAGFRREAATAVAGATLPTLARLVDAALVRGSPSGRYAVHPLVAAYFRDRLEELPDDLAATEARLRSYVAGWLGEQRARIERGRQVEVFAALREEWPNVGGLLERALAERDVDSLEPFLGLIDVTHEARGALAEGRALLGRADALLAGDPARRSLRAQVLIDLGWFDHRLGALDEGAARTREALALIDERTEPTLAARALSNLAVAEGALGRLAAATPLLRHALALARSGGDGGVLAGVLGALGIHTSESGDHEGAIRTFQEAVDLHERSGRILSTIRELGNLAIAYGICGDLARSGELMERSLELARAVDFRQSMPFTLSNLGVHHARLGDAARALELNLEARAIAEETGQRPILVGILVNLAEAHAALGDVAAAVAASDAALDLALDLAVEPLQVQALEARAELLARHGDPADAARLVQVVRAHPATRAYTGSNAEALWTSLTERLDRDARSAAEDFGRLTPLAEALAWCRGRGARGQRATQP